MLSNKEGSAAKGFFYSAVFWLVVPVFVGLLMATLLSYPTLQQYIPTWLKAPINFGRLRPMHTNLAALSQAENWHAAVENRLSMAETRLLDTVREITSNRQT